MTYSRINLTPNLIPIVVIVIITILILIVIVVVIVMLGVEFRYLKSVLE